MNPRCCLPQKKYDTCNKCGEEPGRAILKCANGFSVSNLVTVALPTGAIAPVPLGSLSIDTSKLCSPSILFTLSGRISTLLALAVGLTINVTKVCDGVRQVIGSLPITPGVSVLLSDSFAFQICDANTCNCECVTYTIELVPAAAIAATIGLTIDHIVLSALAVEKVC